MLGKLIKYEFKATYSIHLLMCAIVLGMSVICGLFSLIPTDQIVDDITHAGTVFAVMLQSLLQMLLGLMMSGITVTTLILIAVRFYKNLLGGDEGYLMFTLPVSRAQLLWSKLITAMCYIVLTSAVCMLANILAYLPLLIKTADIEANPGDVLAGLRDILQGAVNLMRQIGYSDVSVSFMLASLIVSGIISIPVSVLRFYSSVSIGHLAKKHRVVASFGAFFGFYAALQLITLVAFICLFVLLTADVTDQIRLTVTEIGIYTLPLFSAGQFILHYLITRNVMNKHLNLR